MQSIPWHVNKAMQRVPLASSARQAASSEIIYGSSLHFIWEVEEKRETPTTKLLFAEKILKNLLQVQSVFHQFSRECFVKLSASIENPQSSDSWEISETFNEVEQRHPQCKLLTDMQSRGIV